MDTKTSKGVKLSKAGNVVSAFGGWVILILTLLIFIFLTMQSLLNTTVIYDAPEDPSTVLFYTDNFYINLFIIAVIFLCGVIFLKKLMNKINPKIFAAILLVYIFVLSLIWNLLTKITPAHDSYYLINAASLFAKNDYSALSSDDKYFIYYPFQLGYTFFAEIIHRISEQNALFILQIFNMLSAVAIAAALIFISDLAFNKLHHSPAFRLSAAYSVYYVSLRKSPRLCIFNVVGCICLSLHQKKKMVLHCSDCRIYWHRSNAEIQQPYYTYCCLHTSPA